MENININNIEYVPVNISETDIIYVPTTAAKYMEAFGHWNVKEQTQYTSVSFDFPKGYSGNEALYKYISIYEED